MLKSLDLKLGGNNEAAQPMQPGAVHSWKPRKTI